MGIYFWSQTFSLAFFNSSINDFPLSQLLLFYSVTLCIFFFQRAIVLGSQWDINDLLRFTWGKLKEGAVYRGVARVQGCAHGLAMVGCCHLHEAWRGKWRKSQHWSLREFTLLRGDEALDQHQDMEHQGIEALRHWGWQETCKALSPHLLRSPGGASQLSTANSKLEAKGPWVLPFIGYKAEQRAAYN